MKLRVDGTGPKRDRRSRAVVIGGSVGGLAAAHALATRFETVVVVEPHRAPDGAPGSVVPHGALPHVLLAGGARALGELVPGFARECFSRGAVGDFDGPRPCHWWAAGRVRDHVPELGIRTPMCSRPLVEEVLRTGLGRHANVWMMADAVVRRVEVRDGAVTGVQVEGPDRGNRLEHWDADLVVDASGRGSRGPGWWQADRSGVGAPTRVQVDVSYTAVEVRRDPSDLGGALIAVVQNHPGLARVGVALPAEGGRWMVVLGGYFGDRAPTDPAGLRDFARSLPDPAIATLLDKEWLGEPRRHGFPSSQRRDWRRIRPPRGFVPVGDSVASFNPLYGQGMTSAALQAVELARQLDQVGNTPGLTSRVVRGVTRIADNPWRIATGADFIYPQTRGARAAGTDRLNRYLARVMAAAAVDESVNLALSRVQQLLADPRTLLAPRVVRTVLRGDVTPPIGHELHV